MENDLISSLVLGAVLIGILIPLIGVLKYFRKQNHRLDEVRTIKKYETRLESKSKEAYSS